MSQPSEPEQPIPPISEQKPLPNDQSRTVTPSASGIGRTDGTQEKQIDTTHTMDKTIEQQTR